MANTFLTPSIIAKEAMDVLRANAVMANLVHRDYSNDFVGAVGDTITVRKPATFVANEYNASQGLTVQDATETGVPVQLNKHLDVSFAVTSKQLALSIEDFSKQLIVPAMQAFADKIDAYLIGLQSSVTNRVPHASGAVTTADIIAARKFLVDAKAPTTDRHFVYGSNVEADLLATDLFIHADQVGDNGTALREASLGRKYGMDFYCDQNVVKDSGVTPAIAFHKNAFALVTRQLALPQGAANSYTTSYDGFGLRVVMGYDMDKKTDTISIDMLCGVAVLDKNLAAVINDAR